MWEYLCLLVYTLSILLRSGKGKDLWKLRLFAKLHVSPCSSGYGFDLDLYRVSYTSIEFYKALNTSFDFV